MRSVKFCKLLLVKMVFLLLGAMFPSQTNCQQLVVRFETQQEYNKSRRIENIELGTPFVKDPPTTAAGDGTYFKSLSSNPGFDTTYKTVKLNDYIGIRFSPFDFGKGTQVRYYKITKAGTYSGEEFYGRHIKQWARLRFNATAYDVPQISKITNLNCSSLDCSGDNICIDSDNTSLRFYLTATNHGNADLVLFAYDSKGIKLGSVSIGKYASYKDITIKSLSLHRHYGKKISFCIYSYLKGQTAEGVHSIYELDKMVEAPRSVLFKRSSCSDAIHLGVSTDIGRNYGRYSFSINGVDGDINLVSERISLTELKLSPVDTSSFPDIELNNIQIQDRTGVNCARNISVSLPAKPKVYSLSATPQSYTFKGNTYHITKPGAKDGKANLTLTGGANNSIQGFKYSIDQVHWHDISSDNLGGGLPNYIFKNLSPYTKYYIKAIEKGGCEGNVAELPFLYEPENLRITNTSIDTVTCHVNNSGTGSKNNGKIYANFAGGIGNYTVWMYDNYGTEIYKQENIDDYNHALDKQLTAGEYTLTVKDRFQNPVSKTVHVVSNPELTITSVETRLLCQNDNTGIITLEAGNRKTSNVTFELEGYGFKPTTEAKVRFGGLPAGNYIASVTNDIGCKASKPVELTQPDSIEILATPSKIARYGDSTGTIALDISKGTGAFNYWIFRNSIKIDSGNTTNLALISGLPDGMYKVEVTDANACFNLIEDIHVRQPDSALKLQFTQKDVDCFGNATGEVYPIATGGWGHYQFSYNNDDYGTVNIISGLKASGTIPDTLYVTDSALVVEKLAVDINQPDKLIIEKTTPYNLKCFEDNSGAVKLAISGGTNLYEISSDGLSWTAGDSLSGLSAKVDQVIYIKDSNGCPEQVKTTITQPEHLDIATDTVIDAYCKQNNGGINVLVNGGTKEYTYQWSYVDSLKNKGGNYPTLNSIYSGEYKLMVRDKHQCKDSMKFFVADIDAPVIEEYEIDSVHCYGGNNGQLTLTKVTGGMPGYKYYLDGIERDSEVLRGLQKKEYQLRIIDKKGCQTGMFFQVPEADSITIEGTVINPVCHDSFDGYIISRSTGGNGRYTYQWSSGHNSANLEKLNKGIFILDVADWKGCKQTSTYEIVPPLEPTANLQKDEIVLCTGNSIKLDGGAFEEHTWYKDKQILSIDRNITLSETGTYVLKVTTELGCIGLDSVQLKVSDTPLSANVLVQDSAVTSEIIEAIDVTWPVPDSIQWFFDSPVDLVENNEWFQQFTTTSEGIVNVTLRAWYGGCYSDSSKSVMVYHIENNEPQTKAGHEPLIEGVKAWPNPNKGEFYLTVELSEVADITLKLLNLGTGGLTDRQEHFGLSHYDIPYTLTQLNTGSYLIVVSAGEEQQKLKIIID